MKRILLIGGARPNFMKLAPLVRALTARGIACPLLHTGQHYDPLLSDIFFRELELPTPAYALGVGSSDRRTQTQAIMRGILPIFRDEQWDAVLVVGDVTSTVAATMAAVESGVPVIHVEAGLRSFRWQMAEELNRVFVDHYAEWLFTTEPSAKQYLLQEGVSGDRIHEVGNVMVDTMHFMKPKVDASRILEEMNLASGSYGVLTIHRPELIDSPERLQEVWEALNTVHASLPLVFPTHPRTRRILEQSALLKRSDIRCIDPLGYADMQRLVREARCVFTDSGGLQEETTVLGIPCFTLREETERPVTISEGTSVLVGHRKEQIVEAFNTFCTRGPKQTRIPAGWDGHAAERIADILLHV